jgi:N-acetyl-anhydromuramyl-L-alanine amidase AmpD
LREINSIWVHCTATKPSQDIGVKTVRSWHVRRGWSDIGYHFLIKRDGKIQKGRKIERAGAHTRGYNSTSVGIALVGGINEKGRPQFNFTKEQMVSLDHLATELCETYGIDAKKVRGHNEVSAKACPCFDVPQWFSKTISKKPEKRDATDRLGW